MSKLGRVITILLFLIVSAGAVLTRVPGLQPAQGASTPITFPDPGLEAAIREAIQKPTGQLYDSDVQALSWLDARARGVTDLSGLEYCSGLTGLELRDNDIVDISPIAGLIGLQRLYLFGCQMTDLAPLAGLSNLTRLGLDQNYAINDVSPLAGLTKLEYLGLGDNLISDVSPLAGLTNLDTLYLYRNQISDISPISSLAGLATLGIGGNHEISDISTLAALTSLEWLGLDYNKISDLSPLVGMDRLAWLAADHNRIEDISDLSGLTSLKYLRLGYNEISDIRPLAGLTALTELSITANQICDVEPLADNPGLGAGSLVDLSSNPLNSASVNTWIPLLLDRGATVAWDTINTVPSQPNNVLPSDNEKDQSLNPSLRSSLFSDPDDGDVHTASQWQITTVTGDYSSPIFDSGVDTMNLTSVHIPAGVLKARVEYYWRVRYRDGRGDWSMWSNETRFGTTSTSFRWLWVVVGVAGVVSVLVAVATWVVSRKRRVHSGN
ncbi:MAG: leucine-rich repeat domain-containing protein [Dehalococcoidia bacterium]|nr:leucine-rich repeat domain-containing protein [Dehalococcoidia bacterium]